MIANIDMKAFILKFLKVDSRVVAKGEPGDSWTEILTANPGARETRESSQIPGSQSGGGRSLIKPAFWTLHHFPH